MARKQAAKEAAERKIKADLQKELEAARLRLDAEKFAAEQKRLQLLASQKLEEERLREEADLKQAAAYVT